MTTFKLNYLTNVLFLLVLQFVTFTKHYSTTRTTVLVYESSSFPTVARA